MDTELLKTFLEVQKTRHFGKAAENLYLTQSAVSFRIRQLEQSLGVSLFTRFRNNIQLTAAGEQLLPHAQQVLVAIYTAKQQLSQHVQPKKAVNLKISQELQFLLHHLSTSAPCFADIAWQVDSHPYDCIKRQTLEPGDCILTTDASLLDQHPDHVCLGLLELRAVSSIEDLQNGAEVCLDIPDLPKICPKPLKLKSSDPQFLLNFMLSQPAYGYLPVAMIKNVLAQSQLQSINVVSIKRPVWLLSTMPLGWASQWQQALQQLQVLSIPD